jgi:hypothetical protein
MITTYLQGGLGNYMFQIATTYSLALDNDDEAIFNIEGNLQVHNHLKTYIDNIFRNVRFEITPPHKKVYNESLFNFIEIPYEKDLYLIGYFQSEKYFIHNRTKILELFSPRTIDMDYIMKKYDKLLKHKTCSLHVRRGDYIKLQNHHPLCDLNYYKNALSHIDNDVKILVFSDDITWCKNNFTDKRFIFIEDEKDIIDLYLMSMCDNNIIANSSFSWWGGWLNQNINKKVISPKKWFGDSKSHISTKDIYCKEWLVL